MKQTVYVVLRGGLNPSTYVGTYATPEGALKALEECRRECPDYRFIIIDAEVQP